MRLNAFLSLRWKHFLSYIFSASKLSESEEMLNADIKPEI